MTDMLDLIEAFSNFVQNERVRSFNEGVDVERSRCAAIADEHADAQCTGQGSETAAMRLGAQSIARAIREPR